MAFYPRAHLFPLCLNTLHLLPKSTKQQLPEEKLPRDGGSPGNSQIHL